MAIPSPLSLSLSLLLSKYTDSPRCQLSQQSSTTASQPSPDRTSSCLTPLTAPVCPLPAITNPPSGVPSYQSPLPPLQSSISVPTWPTATCAALLLCSVDATHSLRSEEHTS